MQNSSNSLLDNIMMEMETANGSYDETTESFQGGLRYNPNVIPQVAEAQTYDSMDSSMENRTISSPYEPVEKPHKEKHVTFSDDIKSSTSSSGNISEGLNHDSIKKLQEKFLSIIDKKKSLQDLINKNPEIRELLDDLMNNGDMLKELLDNPESIEITLDELVNQVYDTEPVQYMNMVNDNGNVQSVSEGFTSGIGEGFINSIIGSVIAVIVYLILSNKLFVGTMNAMGVNPVIKVGISAIFVFLLHYILKLSTSYLL